MNPEIFTILTNLVAFAALAAGLAIYVLMHLHQTLPKPVLASARGCPGKVSSTSGNPKEEVGWSFREIASSIFSPAIMSARSVHQGESGRTDAIEAPSLPGFLLTPGVCCDSDSVTARVKPSLNGGAGSDGHRENNRLFNWLHDLFDDISRIDYNGHCGNWTRRLPVDRGTAQRIHREATKASCSGQTSLSVLPLELSFTGIDKLIKTGATASNATRLSGRGPIKADDSADDDFPTKPLGDEKVSNVVTLSKYDRKRFDGFVSAFKAAGNPAVAITLREILKEKQPRHAHLIDRAYAQECNS